MNGKHDSFVFLLIVTSCQAMELLVLNFVKQGLRNWPMCMIPMFSHNARNEHIFMSV